MKKEQKQIAVEYSVKNNAFNIDLLEKVVAINNQMALNKRISEFVIIAIFNDYIDASKYVEELKKTI